jgi:HEAT repeat protein
MATPEPLTGSAAEEEPPTRQSTPFLVLQFFIFPMSIVAVCVGVFVVFGMIASEGKGAREHLTDVRTGGANRRWQAAYELAKVLQAGKDPALTDPVFTGEVVKVFDEAGADDPRVRRYLALALGRIGDARAVPALLKAVDEAAAGGSRADPETQVYAVWALGAIGDAQAVPRLVTLARSEDAGLRKAAVHALGAFPNDASREALAAALSDPVTDVRWNAAVALARRRDAAAAPVLLSMMDRAALASVPGLTDEQRAEAMVQGIEAAAVLHDPQLDETIKRLRDTDPDLKVRQAAHGVNGSGDAAPRPPNPPLATPK